MWDFKTIIEPFRIKMVETIPLLSREERLDALKAAGYNLFKLPAEKVTIDLLTDSGTGAMSAAQWGAMMTGDESYAGSRSFQRLYDVVFEMTGIPHIFPVHQGRAAERILARSALKSGETVVSNTHFDTTRANIESVGAVAEDLPLNVAPAELGPFKGDIDLPALAARMDAGPVAAVLMTLTNNAVGGQPVSLANVRAVRQLCDQHDVPLWLDAARFAENAWFVHVREPGMDRFTPAEIARQFFDLADGFTLSAKKDGMVNIGGLLGLRDPRVAARVEQQLILGEGYPTYGGLAGRDIDAMAVGLREALDPEYLRYRARSVAYLAEGLQKAGIPVVLPPGGHAVYIDAGAWLPHIPASAFPAQAVGAALYIEGGVRGVEVGSLMFPGSTYELFRLALPRRVYTQAHVNYVIEVAERVAERAHRLEGYRILEEPAALRHFSAVLTPLLAG